MNARFFRIPALAAATLAALPLVHAPVAAQDDGRPTLHVNPRWKECSFQLDPSLTQAAWRQFTGEAGVVVYFRPLADARPLGRGGFEVSLLQWGTAIDDSDSAWNDTFVHPDSTHWLFEGDRLQFPGIMARAGISDRTDIGVYATKNPRANYGVFGAQIQRAFLGAPEAPWAASARLSFVSLFGPEDLDLTLYGADLVASRTIPIAPRAAVSPYAGLSTYFATSHEKSAVVDLDDERVLGAQLMVGTTLRLWGVRLAAEYGFARVNSLSFRIGLGRG